ncbi:hypothetical protein [Ramlibacter algicola]|uniref:Uncharacterized protein n=1 Tax=Ramlibacter algicola TaxID=2795217 RepID=A0A934PZS8_9BURK|nr:hypothetical protein [Ramlibacter algicola]MBK0392103.1 hypothetical protein [Ramlibacter algicola]
MKNEINTTAIKSRNRARMPTVAKLVDEYREVFPGLKVTYASEGGVTLGAVREAKTFSGSPPATASLLEDGDDQGAGSDQDDQRTECALPLGSASAARQGPQGEHVLGAHFMWRRGAAVLGNDDASRRDGPGW